MKLFIINDSDYAD